MNSKMSPEEDPRFDWSKLPETWTVDLHKFEGKQLFTTLKSETAKFELYVETGSCTANLEPNETYKYYQLAREQIERCRRDWQEQIRTVLEGDTMASHGIVGARPGRKVVFAVPVATAQRIVAVNAKLNELGWSEE